MFDSNYIPTIFITGNPADMENLIKTVPATLYNDTKFTFIGPEEVLVYEASIHSITSFSLLIANVTHYIYRIALLVSMERERSVTTTNKAGDGCCLKAKTSTIATISS